MNGIRTLDIRAFGLDPEKEEDRKKGYAIMERIEELRQKGKR